LLSTNPEPEIRPDREGNRGPKTSRREPSANGEHNHHRSVRDYNRPTRCHLHEYQSIIFQLWISRTHRHSASPGRIRRPVLSQIVGGALILCETCPDSRHLKPSQTEQLIAMMSRSLAPFGWSLFFMRTVLVSGREGVWVKNAMPPRARSRKTRS